MLTSSDPQNNLKQAQHFLMQGRLDLAHQTYSQLLNADPENIEASLGIAKVNLQKGALDIAQSQVESLLSSYPDFSEAYNTLGLVYKLTGNMIKAVQQFEKSIDLDPNFVKPYVNLADILSEQGRIKESIETYEKAIALAPNDAMIHYFMSATLAKEKRIPEAINCCKNATTIQPNNARFHFQLACLLIMNKEYKSGWAEYEWRYTIDPDWVKAFDYIDQKGKPKWQGEDISDKTLLLYCEQGIGDSVQSIRYIPEVVKKAKKTYIECEKKLVPMLSRIDNIEIIPRNSRLPEFDLTCHVMSLPWIFKTEFDSIPAAVPYIHADGSSVARFHDLLNDDLTEEEKNYKKIGIVWKTFNPKEQRRNIEPCLFETLTGTPRTVFYSLQHNVSSQDIPYNVIDLTHLIQHFDDNLSIIENLDLLIVIDTTLGHVAGAMGKKVWNLLPHVSSWRWTLEGSADPWYPTMEIFRQKKPGDWEEVISRVQSTLERDL